MEWSERGSEASRRGNNGVRDRGRPGTFRKRHPRNLRPAQPQDSDTRARRVGQGVGAGLAMIGGGMGTAAGGMATATTCTADVASAPTVVGPLVLTPACVGMAGATA